MSFDCEHFSYSVFLSEEKGHTLVIPQQSNKLELSDRNSLDQNCVFSLDQNF